MLEKTCFKCNITKPIDHFYKHPRLADGHLNKCKDCAKRDVHKNYNNNLSYYKAYEMARSQTEGRKQSALVYQKRRRAKNPLKYKASCATNNAIRDGRIVRQPCEVCSSLNVEAHHWDYSRPLDVHWLCRKHHLEVHNKQTIPF